MKNIEDSESDVLQDLIPELQGRGVSLDLERMSMALKAMGEPCKSIPAIQIVGTNGKGSIASFLKSSLQYLGIKAGITTSPHLVSWRERVCVDGELITLNEFRNRLIALKPLSHKYRLTPFELIIALALDHFRLKKVELLVLEVGLGGRLDATTAHPFRPIIAMSGIGLDHCEHLGNTIEEIAKEKASVIEPKSIVISANQHPKVEEILRSMTAKQNASIHFVEPLSEEWKLGLNGEIQKQNAAVAIGALHALKKLGWAIKDQQLRKGIAKAKWPGRLEKIRWKGMDILIDCAHNPHAADQLSLERLKWKGEEEGVPWILAIQKQKDASSMIRSLIRPNDLAWIIPVPEHTSWTQNELSKLCPNYSKQLRNAVNIEEALSMILLENQWSIPSPVITGSIYLAGDLARKNLINL